MASLGKKEHQFLAELGLAPRNPGSYACGAWGGSGPVITTTNPTNNEVIAEVVEASVDDYEKGISALSVFGRAPHPLLPSQLASPPPRQQATPPSTPLRL